MKTWRSACVAAALIVVLGGCAKDEQPAAIDGKVDIVPAGGSTKADQAAGAKADRTRAQADQPAGANAGTNGAVVAAADPENPGTTDAPEDHAPKREDKKECAAAVMHSNTLLTKHVLALFPGKALRRVDKLSPADTFHCDPQEGPDFGGVSALWNSITGAKAIKAFEADGWTRHDPEGGEPAWAAQGLQHGDGSLNYEPAEKYIVTFRITRGGRDFWAELTQDGLRAGLDDAA